MNTLHEVVVISGKGGTGKTSVVASFAALAEKAVLADCDVDAADLHLVMSPEIQQKTIFKSGHKAVIRQKDCIRCGACLSHCRFGAVKMNGKAAGEATFTIDPISCEGCGVCVKLCPAKAIDFPESFCGEWYVSDTRYGPMVHARLGIGAENSGKLVMLVRDQARRIAEQQDRDLLLVDGPPGIGCPVIASITGASLVLIVTEPTLSGQHDLERVLALTRHFDIPAAVCVNKYDLNPDLTLEIESAAKEQHAGLLGRIRYDPVVTAAQIQGKAVVELGDTRAGDDIRKIWNHAMHLLHEIESLSST